MITYTDMHNYLTPEEGEALEFVLSVAPEYTFTNAPITEISRKTPYEWLSDAFIWVDAPQGREYWLKTYRRLEQEFYDYRNP